MYFLFQTKKRHTHTTKQKADETKENRKTKETNGKKEKENVVVINNICGKSKEIRYRLRIYFKYF